MKVTASYKGRPTKNRLLQERQTNSIVPPTWEIINYPLAYGPWLNKCDVITIYSSRGTCNITLDIQTISNSIFFWCAAIVFEINLKRLFEFYIPQAIDKRERCKISSWFMFMWFNGKSCKKLGCDSQIISVCWEKKKDFCIILVY